MCRQRCCCPASPQDVQALIVGTNLGGLGTLIASMASLISYRQIAREEPEGKGRYFLLFTASNLVSWRPCWGCGRCWRNAKKPLSGRAGRRFSVSQRDTLQGEPISARIRGTEIPSPGGCGSLLFAAPVAEGLQKADRCPCSASAVSSAGRASASQSLGTKFGAEPRTRRKAARTLSAPNFPVCVPTVRACRPVGLFDSLFCYSRASYSWDTVQKA